MEFKQLNKIISARVKELLLCGYEICTETSSGTQGEHFFINFIGSDNKHYSLLVDKEHHRLSRVFVLKFVVSNKLNGDLKGAQTTFWRGEQHVTTLKEERFYEVDDNWIVDEQEYNRIVSLRSARNQARRTEEFKFEIPMNKKNQKLVFRLWKKLKSRGMTTFNNASEITSAVIYGYGPRKTIKIEPVNGCSFWRDFDVLKFCK